MVDTVLARLAALKTTPTVELRKQWKDLFDKDPPLYNRRYLESRLAYRIQELAYGGLKPETVEYLVDLGEKIARGENITPADDDRPISGTQLIREWRGVEYRVTVRDFDYEWEGRPYRSLSSVARAITGTHWNGKVFFGLKNQKVRKMKAPVVKKTRCAVYTRKSSEEGLDMEFNSLDAQREACENYIASQEHEGWLLVPDRYDDGGVSGATLERPALKRLLRDIEAGKVDVVVVYKIDRLSRSLMDFAKLVEVFDRKSVTFVSVTQSFNTTTSMGRLTLNVLLSFAQFEREVIGERIRDKVAASKKRGMWMGGWAPLGYRSIEGKLTIDHAEASIVKRVFERFVELGSGTLLVKELAKDGQKTRLGKAITKTTIYKILHNHSYIGLIRHRGSQYPGQHTAIIPQNLWERVQSILAEAPRRRAAGTRAQTPALLKGILFAPSGAMSPTHTRRNGKLYRYYVSQAVLKTGREACPVKRVSAGEIEAAVVGQVRLLLREPEIVMATSRAGRQAADDLSEVEVRDALHQFDDLWIELFPAEQARIVQLLVERVDVSEGGLDIRLRIEGLAHLVRDLRVTAAEPRRAA